MIYKYKTIWNQDHNQNEDTSEGFCPFYFRCNNSCLRKSYLYDYGVAGSLMFFSLAFSSYYIIRHMQYYTNPYFQSKIIVILLMAPFYAVISMLSITFPHAEMYLTLTRDVYEAFLLFTFFYLIFSYLAYDEQKEMIIDEKLYQIMCQYEKEICHMWPINQCIKPYKLTSNAKAKYFTYRCKKYVLQFFVLKPSCSIILLILTIFINEDTKIINGIASFLRWLISISVSYSLYYLVLFYYSLKKPLAPYHPLLKFLTIKITLFFTFWQSLVLGMIKEPLLNCFDKNSYFYSEHRIISGIENTLVCLEMVLMSIAGGIAYSYKPFMDGQVKKGNILDVFKENIMTFKKDYRLIKPKKFGFKENYKQIDYEPMCRISQEQEIEIQIYSNEKDLTKSLLQSYV